MMRRWVGLASAVLAVCASGCAALGDLPATDEPAIVPQPQPQPASTTAAQALRPYYAQKSVDDLPAAPASPALDPNATITRILVGSCLDEEIEAPLVSRMAQAEADLTFLIGDNVYGDIDSGRYTGGDFDVDLKELSASYKELAERADFQALMAARPVLATWDDHDYGVNDAGGDMPAKEWAETAFERFWGMDDEDVSERPGVYYAREFGPDGKRLQVIMLDTRFFRTPLTHTDRRGEAGKERYLPSEDPTQDMLGEDQWAWLLSQMEQPADLRLIVSSVQVTPDAHGWEAWSRLPKSREKLYELIRSLGGGNTVFVSGDRHTAFLYRNTAATGEPILELTASSINKSFAANPDSTEIDPQQIGLGYAFENYGAIEIDWDARMVALSIHDADDTPVRTISAPF